MAKWLFVITVLLVSGVSYYAIEKIGDESALPYFGEEDHGLPDFSFTDQLGKEVTRKDLEGKVVIANYFFTSCPSICPKMTRNLQLIHDVVRQDENIVMLSLTVDPKRDTPERLKKYASTYNVNHDSWHFLTGDKKLLYRMARKGFLISASDGGGDEYDFIHSENVVLLDQEGKIRGFYVGTDAPNISDCLQDIKKLI
ncbi:MAG: SCO family protein [Saprospiraceae bacterium]|nr:SCO family protein [Saprospiraceae bacterium]